MAKQDPAHAIAADIAKQIKGTVSKDAKNEVLVKQDGVLYVINVWPAAVQPPSEE